MSAINLQAYTRKTLSKALHWLDQQPKDLTSHIKDSDMIVRLYLQAQKREQEEKEQPFIKELKKYCAPEADSISDAQTQSQDHFINKNHSSSPAKAMIPTELNWEDLDIKSKELIEKTKTDLNLGSSEQALRVLIQLGYKSLKPLLNS